MSAANKINKQAPFIIDAASGRNLSYGEFLSLAQAYKEKLALKPGEKVCLVLPNCLELTILYFACLLARAVAVPVDPAKGMVEIEEILKEINAGRVITDLVELANVSGDKAPDLWQSIEPDQVFLLTFTSGTTSRPKGVQHSFSSLVASALAFNKAFGFGPQNVFYHNLPMTYMAGILNLLILPFISGSSVILGQRFNVSRIIDFWSEPIKYRANTFWLIPTILSLLVKLDRAQAGVEYCVKEQPTICVGTAPLSNSLKQDFEAKYQTVLYQSYGLSETLFVSTNAPAQGKAGGVGRLLEGVKIDFAPDDEILIETPWMFKGYSNVDTQSYFRGTKYRSGDLGQLDANDKLYITGRKKDLIIRGGINISPKRVEEYLLSHCFLNEVVLVGTPDPVLGEKSVCFFTAAARFEPQKLKQLNQALVGALGRDYHVDQFKQLDELPKNINGKIDKQKLKSFLGQATP